MYQSEVSSYANYTLSINIQLYSEDSYSAGCISVITIERSSFCDLYNRILLTTLPVDLQLWHQLHNLYTYVVLGLLARGSEVVIT